MHTTSEGTLTMIPVQILGIPVGAARITASDVVELVIVMGMHSELGKEFREKIEKGEAVGIRLELITDV